MNPQSLREAIYEHLLGIDEILENQKVPIHHRIFRAAYLFVDLALEATEEAKSELLGSVIYRDSIVPLVSDWYWDKYGTLCRDQRGSGLSGILSSYAQPLLIKIPQTLSRIEVEGESLWLTFPDALREDESIQEMMGNVFDIARLPHAALIALKAEAESIVGFVRSINLNLMSKEGLDDETFSLSQTIWAHYEKAVRDILTLTSEGASAACWDLHLAVEKSYKVLIRAKQPGAVPFGHDLDSLHKAAVVGGTAIDVSLMKKLPKDKSANKFRYAEILIDTATAIDHYRTALELTNQITCEIPRKMKLNNCSLLVKMAPWAK